MCWVGESSYGFILSESVSSFLKCDDGAHKWTNVWIGMNSSRKELILSGYMSFFMYYRMTK